MDLTWAPDPSPTWDDDRQRIVGSHPRSFPALADADAGARLPGRWWRAVRDGKTVGFGWMDVTWGDAEVWLAADPEAEHTGVGTFLLEHLSAEARRQGLRYLFNAIPPKHEAPDALKRWLERRGFGLSGDGLYKRLV